MSNKLGQFGDTKCVKSPIWVPDNGEVRTTFTGQWAILPNAVGSVNISMCDNLTWQSFGNIIEEISEKEVVGETQCQAMWYEINERFHKFIINLGGGKRCEHECY